MHEDRIGHAGVYSDARYPRQGYEEHILLVIDPPRTGLDSTRRAVLAARAILPGSSHSSPAVSVLAPRLTSSANFCPRNRSDEPSETA